MSDAVVIAIVTGLTTAIPIIVTQIAGIIMSARRGDKAAAVMEKSDKKLDEIHIQTNSNLTEQKAQIKALNDRIEALILEKGKAEGPIK